MTIQWKLLAGTVVCIGTVISPLRATATCTQPPATAGCGYDTPTDNSNPDGFYWTATYSSSLPLPQDPNWCPTGVCNQFQARISNRKEDWNLGDWTGLNCSSPGPTVLFLDGGAMTVYHSDGDINPDNGQGNDPPMGIRMLEKQLFEKGARILEIRYRCPMVDSRVGFYNGTESCQHTFLDTVLHTLATVNITEHPPGQQPVETDEKWWPPATNPYCRFAHSVSEGELQLQFSIDVLDNDVGIMNRVIMEGGGTQFDLRGLIDCADTGDGDDLLPGCAWEGNDSCKNLEQTAFVFSEIATPDVVDVCGGCWNGCAGHSNNCDNPNVPHNECYQTGTEEILDLNSIHHYIGDPDHDTTRILGGLVVTTGQDHGVNEEANVQYLAHHAVTNKALWKFSHCQCTCSFWAHGSINRVYEVLKGVNLPEGRTPVSDWVEFFLTGDRTFDANVADPGDPIELPCPEAPETVQCEIVGPPDDIKHPDPDACP
jgi:hypothetical protein